MLSYPRLRDGDVVSRSGIASHRRLLFSKFWTQLICTYLPTHQPTCSTHCSLAHLTSHHHHPILQIQYQTCPSGPPSPSPTPSTPPYSDTTSPSSAPTTPPPAPNHPPPSARSSRTTNSSSTAVSTTSTSGEHGSCCRRGRKRRRNDRAASSSSSQLTSRSRRQTPGLTARARCPSTRRSELELGSTSTSILRSSGSHVITTATRSPGRVRDAIRGTAVWTLRIASRGGVGVGVSVSIDIDIDIGTEGILQIRTRVWISRSDGRGRARVVDMNVERGCRVRVRVRVRVRRRDGLGLRVLRRGRRGDVSGAKGMFDVVGWIGACERGDGKERREHGLVER